MPASPQAMNNIFIVLPILTLLMFQLGLTLTVSDFKLIFSHPKPILIALTGQIILLPALAFLVAVIAGLPPLFFIGLVLIACCPGGSSSNVFSYLAKGDVELSVSLTALSSVITLFTLPPIMYLVMSNVNSDLSSGNIQLPVVNLLIQNLLLMFLPLTLGMQLRKFRKHTTLRIEKIVGKMAFPMLMLLAGIFFVQNYRVILDNIILLGLTAMLLLALTCAWTLSSVFSLPRRQQRTIIIEVGMQNAAQAIAVASSPFIFNSDIIAIPAIIYALMMNITLLTYVAVIRKAFFT